MTALISKPGITSASTLSIPKSWDMTWFRNFIQNQLKGADVRNAIGANGIKITGNIASPYATIGLGPITLPVTAGQTGITVSAAGATAFTVMEWLNANGSGDIDITAAGNTEIGTLGANSLIFFTNNITRLQIGATGLLIASSSPLSPSTTQLLTGLAAVKTSSTTASNNTLTTDAALTLTFNELGWYQIEIWLPFFEGTLGTGGFQADFLNGGTSSYGTVNWSYSGFGTAAIASTAAQVTSGAISVSTVSTNSAAPSWLLMKGIIQVIVAGTGGVRWAQVVTTGADPTTLMAGAYVIATKMK